MAAVALFMVGRLAKFNDIFTSTVPTINNFSNHALKINCLTLFVQLKLQNNILFLYTTDFCSITGHAFWPDMPMDLGRHSDSIGIHLGGFAKLRYYWEELLSNLAACNKPGSFVTLPSYEWHSMEFGDYNCYFNAFDAKLIDAPDRTSLARSLEESGSAFMMMPHHCAYVRGFRGLNWDAYDTRISPLVEIYSNHGCGESDDAPYDYHHSMGPRVGESMVRAGLLAGHRFGFAAGTDSHDGYPGHYGHGRVGVMAESLTLPCLWKGLTERRTIATTGTHFNAMMKLDDAEIGGVARAKKKMCLRIEVEGSAPIERVDLIRGENGTCSVRRLAGQDLYFLFTPGRYKVKVECGWGRGKTRSDWLIMCHVLNGRILGCQPCFRNSTFAMDEEESSERILERTEDTLKWTCRAVPNPSGMMGGTHFNASGTQAVILDLEAGSNTSLQVKANGISFDLPVSDLVNGSVAKNLNGLGSPALKIHRAVAESEFTFKFEETLENPPEINGFLYARIVQSDGQVGWTSPIWYD